MEGPRLRLRSPIALTAEQRERYSRHLLIPEVGLEGQQKLLEAKVLLIGAGGLGSPAALYLAAAGVGTLGIVDNDEVDLSNLQRQVIHNNERIGVPKVESAKQTIEALNPDVEVVPHPIRLDRDNVLDLIRDYDVIVDGADNFPTRYLLNDAAVRERKPVVHASILGFDGQLTTFVPYEGPCYRCLYPQPPPAELAPSCGANGVLGVLPGIMGLLQANEVIKLVIGMGEPLVGRLLLFEALSTEFTQLKVRRDVEGCPTCGEGVDLEHTEFEDYEALCAAAGLAVRLRPDGHGQDSPGAAPCRERQERGRGPGRDRWRHPRRPRRAASGYARPALLRRGSAEPFRERLRQ